MVELHREGSAPAACAAGLFINIYYLSCLFIVICHTPEKNSNFMATTANQPTFGSGKLQGTLHCCAYILQHCTVLHCTVLHCTIFHFTALHCTIFHCIVLPIASLHCTALHCTALHLARFFRLSVQIPWVWGVNISTLCTPKGRHLEKKKLLTF